MEIVDSDINSSFLKDPTTSTPTPTPTTAPTPQSWQNHLPASNTVYGTRVGKDVIRFLNYLSLTLHYKARKSFRLSQGVILNSNRKSSLLSSPAKWILTSSPTHSLPANRTPYPIPMRDERRSYNSIVEHHSTGWDYPLQGCRANRPTAAHHHPSPTQNVHFCAQFIDILFDFDKFVYPCARLPSFSLLFPTYRFRKFANLL